MKAKINPFTGARSSQAVARTVVVIASLAAFPTVAMAADINITTSITGSATDIVGIGGFGSGGIEGSGGPGGSGGNFGDNNRLQFGPAVSGQMFIMNSGTLTDGLVNLPPDKGIISLNILGTGNTVTFTGSSTQVIITSERNWGTAGGTTNGSFHLQGTNNTMNVLAGATFVNPGWSGLDGTGNTLNIDGAGSTVTLSLSGGIYGGNGNDGFGNSSGNAAAKTNRVNITSGGALYVYGMGLCNVKSDVGAGKYGVNVNGAGGRSVLGVAAIQYCGAAGNGIAHIFNGGALESISPSRVSPNNSNHFNLNSIYASQVFIDGGVLSYRNASAARMDESTAGNASGFSYAGNNTMRLNNSASTDTGSYRLANNLGSKNYTSLEMINGTTSVARAITVDGDNSGSMLFEGTAATITNGVTLAGSAATLTATGADSTLTGVVSGTSLVKSGAGKLTLLTAPTYTGDTTISEGTLALTNANASNETSSVSIAVGAKLELGIFVNDTVDKLYLAGVQVASGTWGSSTSGAAHQDDAHFAGDGVLNVTSGTGSSSPYKMWAGSASFTADANGDGIANGLAWMLTAGDVSTNACSLLPTPARDASYLTLHFLLVSDVGSAKLFLEYSNDLGTVDSWHAVDLIDGPFGDIVVDVNAGHATDDVTVKIPTSHASAAGRLYARLRAAEN